MKAVLPAFLLLLGGCAAATDLLQSPLTRTERDTYTLLERDTLVQTQLRNPPGEADRGVLFPSLRQTAIHHTAVLRDSIVERHYPNFIRVGLFESVGLLGTAPADQAYDAGLFGLFPDLPQQGSSPRGSPLFTGAWRRFGIVEYRFPWFHGARDWSVGTTAVELFQLRRDEQEWLAGILPLYLRKRWYWREEPPYAAAAIGIGVSLIPSQYLHLNASLEVGSLGGVNLRGYVGFLWGQNPAQSLQAEAGTSVATLYAGLGTSLLDFLNREEELYQEWREHRHSAWSVGLGQFLFLRTSSSRSIWTEGPSPLITGLLVRLFPVQLALPVGPPGFYAGTSLATALLMGTDGGAIGILPLRLGYWRELVPAGLYGDLGAEALYYPSSAVALSARLVLRLSEFFTLCAVAGFANGSPLRGSQWWDLLQEATSFRGWYIGIGAGLGERLFRRDDLWYYRN
ncbi:hypothetical protein HRbin21_01061 [bacterium HR21]|jgi:hypothetical protein|nr:hypothetical protein HRbin21_01061 [bacterium HR21]